MNPTSPEPDAALDMAKLLDQPPNAVAPGSRTGDAVARREANLKKWKGLRNMPPDANCDEDWTLEDMKALLANLRSIRSKVNAALRILDADNLLPDIGDPVATLALTAIGIAQERDKLAAFKKFVHDRLDAADVPTHPDGPHSKEGCRIGDRLDGLIGERNAGVKSVLALLGRANAAEQELSLLRVAFEHIGIGDFRQEWLDEAERIWASRAMKPSPPAEVLVWVTRTRELVQAIIDAHHAAGMKTQYEEEQEQRKVA